MSSSMFHSPALASTGTPSHMASATMTPVSVSAVRPRETSSASVVKEDDATNLSGYSLRSRDTSAKKQMSSDIKASSTGKRSRRSSGKKSLLVSQDDGDYDLATKDTVVANLSSQIDDAACH